MAVNAIIFSCFYLCIEEGQTVHWVKTVWVRLFFYVYILAEKTKKNNSILIKFYLQSNSSYIVLLITRNENSFSVDIELMRAYSKEDGMIQSMVVWYVHVVAHF